MKEYQELNLLPRLELARELSERLYMNYPRRFRELVSNAIDAGATQVIINIDINNDCISVIDNGLGMDPETLREEFLSLGGSQKKASVDKIGRIGVGFLALASLGDIITIKSAYQGNGFKAEIYFDKLLDESIRRKPMHEQIIGRMENVKYAQNGTEIVISQLRTTTKEYFLGQYHDFIIELMKILPLKYNPKSKIFTKLSQEFHNIYLKNQSSFWLPTCQVIVDGIDLKRYCYGDLSDEEIIAIKELNFTIKENNSKPITVIGYAIDAGRQLPKETQGFISRVKNVAVEENGFLAMKVGAQSQRARVTGELHIFGLNDNIGINLDRTSFNYDLPDIHLICNKLDSELESFFLEVRNRSSEHSSANKVRNTVTAFQSLTQDISKTLQKYHEENKTENNEIQHSDDTINIPKKSMKDILIEAGAQPTSEPNIQVKYEGNSWITKVPSKILENIGKITLSGVEYEISFSNFGADQEPCKIVSKQIYYNLDHPLVINNLFSNDNTLFKLMFCLAYAYNKTIGKSAGDMYREVIKLLKDVISND
ncbi:hypothetical protein G7K71_18615 [Desulfofundulus sp. TPOSR]|uniref:ATP-binding protein n=1 Tax=Desulfofundulus sp. TPOSR TaxID=2714340 RepID=UPI00140AB397|nr:ATP-binding protein [Desulfofundulus sp. TPOSR]NHM28938.1 hypothetical protein [Desulfofundulus sp. TPOSR]